MPLGSLPPNLEKVAEAGGWEARAKLKAQQEFTERLQKINKNQWEGINENLTILEGFIDKSAGNVLSQLKDDITQTISLKFAEILAPIKNEIYAIMNDALNQALEPVMPYINEGLHWLGVGMGAVLDASYWVGYYVTAAFYEVMYFFFPQLTPQAQADLKAEEEARAAKARRARYQIGNVPGFSSGGGRGGFQSGSGSIGSPPSPPSTGRGGAQE